ncbi:MAG TPA: hypothetical protein VF637_07995 [Sphingomicrobium sp.]
MNGERAQKQARLDGQMAWLAKKPPSANPHPLGCDCSRQWSRGYREIAGEE